MMFCSGDNSSNRKLVQFVNELDRYQLNCDDFFDYGLLDLLARSFGCNNVGITAYNQSQYLGCIGRHKAERLVSDHSAYFHKRDSVSNYITKEYPRLNRPIVRATDLIPYEQYPRSEYAQFLLGAGLRYVSVMVFPQNRICIYKQEDEGDFSDTELDLISCVHSVIEQKYNSYLSIDRQKITNQSKSLFMDRHQIGFLVFDEQKNLLEYNKTALPYVTKLFAKHNMHSILEHITALMERGQTLADGVLNVQHEGFSITMATEMRVDSFGHVKTHHVVTIIPGEQNAQLTDRKETEALRKRYSALTSRELEVLDAFCEGDDYDGIAQALFISANTVRSHLKSIYRKLDVTNQRALIKLHCQYLAQNASAK